MSDEMSDYASQGEYRASESGSVGTGLTLLFIGLAAGALIALLLAPKTGKQMRRTLRRKYEDAREAMEDLGEQASEWIDRGSEWIDRGSEWAEKAKGKVAPLAKPLRR